MNAVGTNTAQSTNAIAMIGPVTSSIAFRVASSGFSPSAIFRSTFSTTTIASSTTIPIATTRPKSERLLMEKPSACITPNVPTSDTGTAAKGIIEARQVCRNNTTTTTTSPMASSNVVTTALIEPRTKTVGSYTTE